MLLVNQQLANKVFLVGTSTATLTTIIRFWRVVANKVKDNEQAWLRLGRQRCKRF